MAEVCWDVIYFQYSMYMIFTLDVWDLLSIKNSKVLSVASSCIRKVELWSERAWLLVPWKTIDP